MFAYISGQSSHPRRHPICWASSQWSHTVSSTPCHGAWTSAPLSTYLLTSWEWTASQIETPICTCRPTTISSSVDNYRSVALWSDHPWNAEWLENTTRLRTFVPDIGTHPPGVALPRTASVRLNRLRTGIGCFRSFLANGLWPWPLLWLVSAAQRNKQLTKMSNAVQSIDFAMECIAWWFCMTRQSIIAWHLPRDLVRSNSGLKELAQTMKHPTTIFLRFSVCCVITGIKT